MTFKTSIFIVFTFGLFFSSTAQSERKMTRKGNTQYETGNFIDAEINYKKALPFTPAYFYLNKSQKDFPISHFLQSRILSIPIFPELSHIQIEKILSTLKKFGSINGAQ